MSWVGGVFIVYFARNSAKCLRSLTGMQENCFRPVQCKYGNEMPIIFFFAFLPNVFMSLCDYRNSELCNVDYL